jgi:hypothetical protein
VVVVVVVMVADYDRLPPNTQQFPTEDTKQA